MSQVHTILKRKKNHFAFIDIGTIQTVHLPCELQLNFHNI
jgi:hypothetical protein